MKEISETKAEQLNRQFINHKAYIPQVDSYLLKVDKDVV